MSYGKINVGGGENVTSEVQEQVTLLEELGTFLASKGALEPQEKIVTAETEIITVVPDAGYSLGKVTINPTPSQSKTVTPVPEGMTVVPDKGNLLSNVILNPYELPSPEGQYVWEKCITTPTSRNLWATRKTGTSTMTFKIEWQQDVALETLTTADFVGATMKGVPRYGENYSKYPIITFTSATQCTNKYGSSNTETVAWSWDASTSTITVNSVKNYSAYYCEGYGWLIEGIATVPVITETEYVVADSENAYPNGGIVDGHYYRKPKTKLSDFKIDCGLLVFPSTDGNASPTTVTINHKLGVVPNRAYLLPWSLYTSESDTTYAQFVSLDGTHIECYSNYLETFVHKTDSIVNNTTLKTTATSTTVTFTNRDNWTYYANDSVYFWVVVAGETMSR